jgi:hypothetical protein
MRIPNELSRFADLVEKYFEPEYLKAMSPHESFVDQIREGKIYPIKWLLSEIDKSKLDSGELEFLEDLRQINF